MKYVFFILLTLFSNDSFSQTSTWSEGKCDDIKNIHEGATRDFYNRGAGKTWKNKQGDWLDAQLIPQGNKPFTSINIKNKKKNDVISINVTILVKYWQKNVIVNHGFLVKRLKGDNATFFSKDNSSAPLSPSLKIKTKLKTYHLTAVADTELDVSTYRCLNNEPLLNAYHNLLIRFDLGKVKEDIIEANLQLTSAKDIRTSSLNLYSVNIEPNFYIREFGLVDNYENDEALKHDKHVLYYESFDDEQWREKWGVSFWESYRTTDNNEYESFIPLNKSALEITIKKGKHSGISAHYPLTTLSLDTNKKVKSAYFRYNLQLGSNWSSSTGGKLPGFSGIYGNESYRAGWGGRRSDGTNGWSTRGSFSSTLSNENILASKTPTGSYIYHADMKYSYGDEDIWNLNDLSVLKNNTWYSIEQYVHMNTLGQNDGVLKAWVNGILVYSRDNIRFTDNLLIGIESVWLNIYHGGSATAPKDLTLFIDDLVIASKYIGSRIHNKK
jgi:hypothetical protein